MLSNGPGRGAGSVSAAPTRASVGIVCDESLRCGWGRDSRAFGVLESGVGAVSTGDEHGKHGALATGRGPRLPGVGSAEGGSTEHFPFICLGHRRRAPRAKPPGAHVLHIGLPMDLHGGTAAPAVCVPRPVREV
ncbi:hypothetical protein GCM10010182_80390 [Actinomadura cremea]|nr:hypothetical protein GCM10010182_80390 [Actinomadura cremea]